LSKQAGDTIGVIASDTSEDGTGLDTGGIITVVNVLLLKSNIVLLFNTDLVLLSNRDLVLLSNRDLVLLSNRDVLLVNTNLVLLLLLLLRSASL